MARRADDADDLWLLHQVELLCEKLGVEFTYVPIDSAGGPCRIGQHTKIIVSSRAPASQKVRTLCRALSSEDLSEIYVLPKIRELISL